MTREDLQAFMAELETLSRKYGVIKDSEVLVISRVPATPAGSKFQGSRIVDLSAATEADLFPPPIV